MERTDLKALIDRMGGPTTVAQLLSTEDRKVSQSGVSNWIIRGRIPAEHCRALAAAAGEGVSVHDLRPDIFGPAPALQSSVAA